MSSLIKLKDFLKGYDIILFDEQYRILNALISVNKSGGGVDKNNLSSILGTHTLEIRYNIKKILNY